MPMKSSSVISENACLLGALDVQNVKKKYWKKKTEEKNKDTALMWGWKLFE